jgi:hypothetical protein
MSSSRELTNRSIEVQAIVGCCAEQATWEEPDLQALLHAALSAYKAGGVEQDIMEAATMTSQEQPATKLMQLITGHWVAAAIYAAARLKLADRLQRGPHSSDELAKQLDAHAPSLYRLMRALATLGVLEESAPKTFTLTEVGDLLREDHPQSMRPIALFQGAPAHWLGWGSLLHSVRTGESAFEHVHGQGFFDYCRTDPDFSQNFNAAMTSFSIAAAEAVMAAYDFSGIGKLADVGGGHGHLLCSILQKYLHLKGAVVDLPDVVAGAKKTAVEADVLDRCELVGGSFFDSLPPADAYIAKNIIHDWDDEHSRTILRNMRSAMIGAGKVLLVELVIRADNRATFATLLDLEMLHATHGGRERTEEEFRDLLASAGLRLHRVIETRSQFSVLEALPE